MKTLFTNGRVFSPGIGFFDSFAVEDGWFIPVEKAAKPDRIIDLGGRFVCPGFIDTHLHLVGYGRALCCCDLSAHTGSLREVCGHIKEFLQKKSAAGKQLAVCPRLE